MRPPRIGMSLMLIAAALHWYLKMGERIRFSRPWIGALIGLAGFLIMMWAWLLFKQLDLAVCPTAQTSHITEKGPYRFTRNPMYLGFVLMMAGLALSIGTLPFYLAAIIYFAILNFLFCPYEEIKLMKAFGNEYQKYRNRIRRWI